MVIVYRGMIIMLKVVVIDKCQIHMTIPDVKTFSLLINAIYDTAELFNVKSKSVKNEYAIGRRVEINVANDVLEIGVFVKFGRYWVMYRFNGVGNFYAFEDATSYFGHYSYLWALLNGRVKSLELAIDIAGKHCEEYLFHFSGAKTSRVVSNNAGTGISQYLGGRNSSMQAVAYDKAQERRDKKKPCPCKNLLRLELRIQNQAKSLPHVIATLFDDDPFRRLLVIDRKQALAFKTNIKEWGLFISTCGQKGVPIALRAFKAHKKTFLKYLEDLSIVGMKLTFDQFRKSLEILFPSLALWDAVDAFIASSESHKIAA